MVGKGNKLLVSPPDHFKQLLSNLSTLQSSDRFTDVIFQCAGGQVNAHKAMLIPLSPLLEFLFEVSSSKQASDVTVISLADVDVGPVMRMITYIYSGKLDNSNFEERRLIQQVVELLQIKVDLVVETPKPTPSKTKGKLKKTPRASTPASEKVLRNDEIPKEDFISTPHGKPMGRPKNISEDAMEPGVDLIAPEVSPKSPPRSLGGFRSFDNTQIQEEIMDNAKTRAEMDKMKVGLTNVSQDKNNAVKKMYKSAMFDINKQFHENILENPIAMDDTDDIFTTPRERRPKQGKVDINQKSKEKGKQNEEKQPSKLLNTAIDLVDLDDEHTVEEVIDKRFLLEKEEYLVKWKGWEDIADRTWESVDNLDHAKNLIIAFEKEKTENKKREPKKKKGKEVSLIDNLLDDDYEVERILSKRGKGQKIKYLVKWKNFDKEEDQTWEPLKNLTESSKIVEAFEKEFEVKVKNESQILPQPETPPSFKKTSKRGRSRESPVVPLELDYHVVSPKRGGADSVISKLKDEEPKKKEAKYDEVIKELDYEVEKILDKRGKGRKIEYLVKWKNFEKVEDQTWEPLDNLTESNEIVEAFEKELEVTNQNNVQLLKEKEIPTESKKSSKRRQPKSMTSDENEMTIIISDPAETKDKYEVEQILEVRKGKLGKEYLVKWKGWEDEKDRTWEADVSLEGSRVLLKEFEIEEAKKSNKNVESSRSRGKKKKNETIDFSGVILLNDSKDKEDSAANESNNISVDSEDLPLPTFQKVNKQGRKSKNRVEKQRIDKLKDFECNENGGGEYEIENILDHQEEDGVIKYLVKWKNWDNKEDNSWEPSANLIGSEDVIEKYEKKIKEKKKKDDPILIPDENVDEYEVELIVDKRILNNVSEYLVKWKGWENVEDRTWEPEQNIRGSEKLIKKFESGIKTSKTKLKKQSADDGVVLCVACNRIFLSSEALKSHEEEEHKKPAVTTKKKKVASEVTDEVSPHQSQKYMPGPKSKKLKLGPFSDETLVSDESRSPKSDKGLELSPNRRSSDMVGAIIGASNESKVDLTDSSDDEDLLVKTNKGGTKSFDDLFCETPVNPKKANDVAKIVFNKDSDDESDHEKGIADLDDLMGGSNDEKVGDDV